MTIAIPADHPRVMVRPADLPRLRMMAQNTHRAEMGALLSLASSGGKDADPASDGAHTAWRLAFLYLLTEDKAHAEACAVAIENVLNREVSGGYFEAQRRIRALGCAYDWCHAAFPKMMLERMAHSVIAHGHALYANHEMYPDNHVAGHEVNMVPNLLQACIAIGDEHFGARQLLADVEDRFLKMLECYRFFLEGESFQQSYSYTAAYIPEIAICFQALQAATGVDWFAKHPWYRKFIAWWTYALRSDDTFIRYGDYFCGAPVFGNASYFRPFAAVASHYRDPVAQWWVNRFTVTDYEPEMFFFNERENTVAPKKPETLPRTKLFKPMGVAIARDWGDGTVAAFKCSPIYLHNHCHRDQNQITIYHQGDQAIDSGVYDGYETPHWYNYYIRTIAHNTIVVHDPDEQMVSRGKVYANDGGQRFVNEPVWSPRTLEHLKSEAFRDGEIAAYREESDWSYVCGDASHCYSPRKLVRFLRHVVFVLDWPHPRAVSLVVLDDVEVSRDGLTPRWLLHTVDEPKIAGATISVRQGRGRLTAHILGPAAARIEAIGGPGSEFMVGAQNFPYTSLPKGPHVPGSWRAEVSPAAGHPRRVRFVTMLVPADADAPAEPPATLTSSNDGFIVQQGGLSVVLQSGAKPLSAGGARVVVVPLAGGA
ncbi:MAG: heparinase II/III family protein [Planctomycetes bacterium]|nr:heparinase II/III family protein [Planctomycetota bacterium]